MSDAFHPDEEQPQREFIAMIEAAYRLPQVHQVITLDRIARAVWASVPPDARWDLMRRLAPVKADIGRLSR